MSTKTPEPAAQAAKNICNALPYPFTEDDYERIGLEISMALKAHSPKLSAEDVEMAIESVLGGVKYRDAFGAHLATRDPFTRIIASRLNARLIHESPTPEAGAPSAESGETPSRGQQMLDKVRNEMVNCTEEDRAELDRMLRLFLRYKSEIDSLRTANEKAGERINELEQQYGDEVVNHTHTQGSLAHVRRELESANKGFTEQQATIERLTKERDEQDKIIDKWTGECHGLEEDLKKLRQSGGVSPWIPCSTRLPTKEDADNRGLVAVCFRNRFIAEYRWDYSPLSEATHWTQTRFLPPTPEPEDAFEKWHTDRFGTGVKIHFDKELREAFSAGQQTGGMGK